MQYLFGKKRFILSMKTRIQHIEQLEKDFPICLQPIIEKMEKKINEKIKYLIQLYENKINSLKNYFQIFKLESLKQYQLIDNQIKSINDSIKELTNNNVDKDIIDEINNNIENIHNIVSKVKIDLPIVYAHDNLSEYEISENKKIIESTNSNIYGRWILINLGENGISIGYTKKSSNRLIVTTFCTVNIYSSQNEDQDIKIKSIEEYYINNDGTFAFKSNENFK